MSATKGQTQRRQSIEQRRQEAYDDWQRFKEDVKAAYQIDHAIEEIAGLRLQGAPGAAYRMAQCPFHGDKSPSLSVSPKQGFFCCHGAGCGAKGDVFAFIAQYQGVSFKEAVLIAASKVGISPPEGAQAYRPQTGSAAPRQQRDFTMNPARLFESDLVPAFRGIRQPVPNKLFPVWHAGGGQQAEPGMKRYLPEMVHVYRDMRQMPILVVLRCRHKEDNRKYFMPLRVGYLPPNAPDALIDDKIEGRGWIVSPVTPNHRKPIYGMEDARKWIRDGGKNILIVEGEKCRDAVKRMISKCENPNDWLILAPMGGFNAALYADWTGFMAEFAAAGRSLEDVTLNIWPDADHMRTKNDGTVTDPQALYVADTIGCFTVAARIAGLEPQQTNFNRAQPGYDRENGWDLADAEGEGWTAEIIFDELNGNGMPAQIDPKWMTMPLTDEASGEPAPFEDGSDEFGDLIHQGLHLPGAAEALDMGEGEIALMHVAEDPAPEDELVTLNAAQIIDDGVEGEQAMNRDMGIGEILPLEGNLLPAEYGGNDGTDDLLDLGDGLNGDIDDRDGDVAVRRNSYFRCLGVIGDSYFVMNGRTGQILETPGAALRKGTLLMIAPLDFWMAYFGEWDNKGKQNVNWDLAISTLIAAISEQGYFNRRRVVSQGVRIDGGRVVLNTGDRLWIQSEPDGDGVIDSCSNFIGENIYEIGESCGLPDFANAYTAKSEEPRKLLEIIKNLDWREGSANLSACAFFGWLCIGPITGLLPWRPHIWLDGPSGAGKTWIVDKIVRPTIGQYSVRLKANSTEPGMRATLNQSAFPVVFDEAEGHGDSDRQRMAQIIAMVRHSSADDDSHVAMGTSGGKGAKYYQIKSTFFFSSIAPQLANYADESRFARARIGAGLTGSDFVEKLELPVMDLITPEFSSRFIARIIKRAGSIHDVIRVMTGALVSCQIQRRIADVWGVYLAGIWNVMEDGVPSSRHAALSWIQRHFNIMDDLEMTAAELTSDKDHNRLLRHLMAHQVRLDTPMGGPRMYNLGTVIQLAMADETRGAVEVDPVIAQNVLANIGLRLGKDGALWKGDGEPNSVLIHKNSPRITEILSQTNYKTAYVDIITQAEGTRSVKGTRFAGLGTYRAIEVPMRHFAMEDED